MNTQQKKDEKAIVRREMNLPGIPSEKLDQIISLSDDQTLWVKVIEGGFKIVSQDKFVKSLVGRIVDVNLYLIKFEGGTPTKIPNVVDELEIPEGFERRCDVKLFIGGEIFGISLPPSSTKFYLSPYLKYLKNKNLKPENVLTRLTARLVSNQFRSWSVAVFELANSDAPEKESSKNYPKEWD